MRRTLALLAATLLVASCANRSDRVTGAVSVPTSLVADSPGDVGSGVCSFATGSGHGAVVVEVVAGSAAEGVFVVGDVIDEFDGVTILTSNDLVDEVRAHEPGQVVPITVTRPEGRSMVTVTLGEAADTPGRAALGVLVRTEEELLQISSGGVSAETLEGIYTRVVSVDGELWLLDPINLSWATLDTDAPNGAFLPVDGEIYRVDVQSDGLTAIVGLLGGGLIVSDLGGWEAQTALTTLEHYVLLGATQTADDGSVINAIVAIDPSNGDPGPVWSVDPELPSPIPAVAFRSPDGSRAVVALAAEGGAARPDAYVVVEIEDGLPVAQLPRGVPNGAFVFGWADDETLLTVISTFAEVVFVDPETGTAARTTLSSPETTEWLWPVGDAMHVVADEGDTLVLVDIFTGGRRPITFGCTSPQMSEVGWIGQ